MAKVTAAKPEKVDARERFRRDALINATPAQIDAYVENNVTNLASAKVLLARMLKMIRVLAKEMD